MVAFADCVLRQLESKRGVTAWAEARATIPQQARDLTQLRIRIASTLAEMHTAHSLQLSSAIDLQNGETAERSGR